jgi:hypothetical protein
MSSQKASKLSEMYDEGCRLGLQKEMKYILAQEMKRRGLLKFPIEVYSTNSND